jgi:hypothetical protein
MRSLRNNDYSAVYVVLADEMPLLAGLATIYVLVFAAHIANPFSHGNSIMSPDTWGTSCWFYGTEEISEVYHRLSEATVNAMVQAGWHV